MEFTDILDRHRIPYDTSGRGKNRPGWVQFKCPRCQKPYAGFALSSRAVNCWNCGRLPLGETLQALTGLSSTEVYALIGELPREELPPLKTKHRGRLELPSGLGPLQHCHKQYLKSRGFNPDNLEKLWSLQGTNHLGGALAWRVFVPCLINGEVVSWTTRSLKNEGMRYIDAKPKQSIIPLKDTVYGLHYCRNSVIVAEGPADVWAIGPGAVCLFGLRSSPAQLNALARFPLRVVCFDSGKGEGAAKQRAVKLCRDFSVFDGRTIQVNLNSGKDAASADPQEIEELRKRYLR